MADLKDIASRRLIPVCFSLSLLLHAGLVLALPPLARLVPAPRYDPQWASAPIIQGRIRRPPPAPKSERTALPDKALPKSQVSVPPKVSQPPQRRPSPVAKSPSISSRPRPMEPQPGPIRSGRSLASQTARSPSSEPAAAGEAKKSGVPAGAPPIQPSPPAEPPAGGGAQVIARTGAGGGGFSVYSPPVEGGTGIGLGGSGSGLGVGGSGSGKDKNLYVRPPQSPVTGPPKKSAPTPSPVATGAPPASGGGRGGGGGSVGFGGGGGGDREVVSGPSRPAVIAPLRTLEKATAAKVALSEEKGPQVRPVERPAPPSERTSETVSQAAAAPIVPPSVGPTPDGALPTLRKRSGPAQGVSQAAGIAAALSPPPKREIDPQEVARFKQMVQAKVNAAKEYPSEARLAEQEGQVRVSFVIQRNGQPDRIRVTQSSGHEALDQAATATITRAAPFLPFPESVSAPAVQVTVTVSFKLR